MGPIGVERLDLSDLQEVLLGPLFLYPIMEDLNKFS